jgi:hypothetical protein
MVTEALTDSIEAADKKLKASLLASRSTSTSASSSTSAPQARVDRALQANTSAITSLGGFFAQSQAAPALPVIFSAAERRSGFAASARREIEVFKQVPFLPFLDPTTLERTNPLRWWRDHETSFPFLSKLARRVLCVPATSAPSERLFSVAGQTITKKRNRLTHEHVSLLVHLKNAYPAADAHKEKMAAAKKLKIR